LSHPSVKGVAIYPDKRVEHVTLNGLADYQTIVDGNIEPVTLSDRSTMYVNEEFLYKFVDADGNIDVPKHFNSIAGDVCGLGGMPHLMMTGILGPVVVVGPVDGRGYDKDVTDKALGWIQRVAREAQL